MRREDTSDFISTTMAVLKQQENFWSGRPDYAIVQLLKHSLFVGFFPFAGYLVNYTIRGTIWNVWPFVHTTLDVGSSLVFAGLQWIFFSIFPVLSSLMLDLLTSRGREHIQFEDSVTITSCAIMPLCLSMLFVGVPYFDRIVTTLGFFTFLYLLYSGFRIELNFTIVRSMAVVLILLILFVLIRQMFVFAIGY
jgi:hypothetical protein